MKNGIEENNLIDIINLKEINEDNLIDEDFNEENEDSNEIITNKNMEKTKLKYTEMLEIIKNRDLDEYLCKNEYECNFLLMPSEIDISNKISTLSLISYCYQKSNKAHLIYNISRKFENLIIYLKAADPLFFVHVFFRAGYFLNLEENYIYATKYINKAVMITKDYHHKIQKEKIIKCNEMHQNLAGILIDYTKKILKKFNEEDYFSPDKSYDIKNLVDLILIGKNELNNNNNQYLYIINKVWLIKLKIFIVKYLISIETNEREKFIKNALDVNNFYISYLRKETNDNEINKQNNKKDYTKDIIRENKNENKKEAKKDKKKVEIEAENNKNYISFPGPIDNFCLTDYKDFWKDNINEDENYFLIKDLKLNEDYCLINENHWNILNSTFGSTNKLLRKKDNLELIRIKFILFDKRINNENNNTCLLKLKYIQINKNLTIKKLKEKIINISNYNLEEQNQKSDKIENLNNREIIFYTLQKEQREYLIEMCYSFIIKNQKYDSLYINKINLSDGANLDDFFFEYNKDKQILIVEVIKNDESPFFEDLKIKMKNEYNCSICNKKLNHINEKYNCSFCHFSIFCSKKCADISKEHKNLDKYLLNIIQSNFNLSDLLSLNLYSLLPNRTVKGKVGLFNIGNTCYLNSTLQCLSNTKDLTKYFLKKDFSKEINNGNSSGSKGEISKAYYKLIYQMWNGTNMAIDPSEFRETFCKKEDYFNNYEQHDSQEFLLALLNNIHDDLNRVTNKQYMELKEKQKNESDIQASNRYWDYHKSRENSIIVDLFQGQYKSTIKCTSCKNESITFDTYMNLQLPIPEKKMQSQIKLFLSNGDCIKLSIKLDEYIEIRDVIKKALLYLDYKKYLEYLHSIKMENNIFNYNNKEVPLYLLYNNIIVTEFSSDLKLTNIYNTNYENISNDDNYSFEIITFESLDNKEENPKESKKKEKETIKNKQRIKKEDKIKKNNKKNSKNIKYDDENNNNKKLKNEHKNIINKISNDKDKLLKIYEKNKGEIILFEKNLNSNDLNCIDIFVYPIADIQNKGILGTYSYNETVKLTYPLIITLNKNNTLEELQIFIYQKFSKILNNPVKNDSNSILICFPHFSENWQNFKISNKICPICGENYNKYTKYCLLIKNKLNLNDKISDLIDIIGCERPLILFSISKNYNMNSELYKGLKLSIESKKETELKDELTIYDSLELFHKEEILDREEKWYCNKCSKHQKAIKKMEIYRTPLYLIVQLKRFKQRGALMGSILGNKNETLIDYKEILNLDDFVSGPDKKESIYLLYGVIIHKKLLNGGHYIALCKNDGQWFFYNDKKVGYCENPINKDAYLLFYKRKDNN